MTDLTYLVLFGFAGLFFVVMSPFILFYLKERREELRKAEELRKIEAKNKAKADAMNEAMQNLPNCKCHKCGYKWSSRKKDELPAVCPYCKEKGWWSKA